MKRIVIIGGVAAGPKIAAKLLRTDGDFQIDLYTEEDMISYSSKEIFISFIIKHYYVGSVEA